jgi:Asp/Glu/hydantoin racemase
MRLVQTYGMTSLVSGINTIDLYDTGDLSHYHDVVIERTVAVGRELVHQGAQAIIPLGGKIYPYVVTPEELEPSIGVPIINTKAVGVSYAELMVRSKTSHSNRAYPWSAGLQPDAVSRRSK